jgi:hypothetical protein
VKKSFEAKDVSLPVNSRAGKTAVNPLTRPASRSVMQITYSPQYSGACCDRRFVFEPEQGRIGPSGSTFAAAGWHAFSCVDKPSFPDDLRKASP